MNTEASYLLEQAIGCFDTDRHGARCYLNDALSLLRADPTDPQPAVAISHHTWRPGGLSKWQTLRVLKYIDANLAAKLSATAIANTVALSPSHFSRSFSRALACSPMAYVTTRRVEKAKTLMATTTERLANIALACGFADQPHFNKVFRRWTGLTPTGWRRRNTRSRQTA